MLQLKLFLLPILIGSGFWQPSTTIEPQLSLTGKQATTSNYSKQELFNYLRCHRQAKNIVVNWGMTSQLGVTSYKVYHSEDGDFFDPIATIQADDISLKYSFKHMDVFPALHHYYIVAFSGATEVGRSSTDVVRIVGH